MKCTRGSFNYLVRGGGRHYVVEVEVEWVNDGDPNIF
jgi:hypothetical protein